MEGGEHLHRHGHESSDVGVRHLGLAAASIIIIAAGLHFLLLGLMRHFEDQQSRPVGLARPLSDILPQSAEPPLQAAPTRDLAQFRAAENERLNHYGWVDKPAGVLRIPINRAMDLVAERGVPARSSELEKRPDPESKK